MHPYLLDTLASEHRAALDRAAALGAARATRPPRRGWTRLLAWLRPARPAPASVPVPLTVVSAREAPVRVLRPRPVATHRSARVARRACSRAAS
jgi:hypothetical protein